MARQLQLMIQKRHVEGGVVNDERRVGDEIEKFHRHLGEFRLVAQKLR